MRALACLLHVFVLRMGDVAEMAHARTHAHTHMQVDFFNQINLLYGSITEFCTSETCACMSAG